MQLAPLTAASLPVEILTLVLEPVAARNFLWQLMQCRAVNRHWCDVVEGPWLNEQYRRTLESFTERGANSAVHEGGDGSASLFQLVLNKYQTWCPRWNEPRPPLMPYGISRLLDFWCHRNEATLAQLPVRPVIGLPMPGPDDAPESVPLPPLVTMKGAKELFDRFLTNAHGLVERKCKDMARRNAADLFSDPRLLQLALYAYSGPTAPIAADLGPLLNQRRHF
ncbi:hypothetical protein GGF32_007470 [Allomyces javanicus]|nr:hypothetical protein GGF32_007470 [Allomyces javanicus]